MQLDVNHRKVLVHPDFLSENKSNKLSPSLMNFKDMSEFEVDVLLKFVYNFQYNLPLCGSVKSSNRCYSNFFHSHVSSDAGSLDRGIGYLHCIDGTKKCNSFNKCVNFWTNEFGRQGPGVIHFVKFDTNLIGVTHFSRIHIPFPSFEGALKERCLTPREKFCFFNS